jgi:predicted DNA-binding protein
MTRCVFVFTFQRLSCPLGRENKILAQLISINIACLVITLINNMKETRIQVNFRMTKSLKEKLGRQAKELGTSMRKIIENSIEDIQLPDNRIKKQQFETVNALCKEINYIGKNINQLTIALRQIRADRKIEDGEFFMLVDELKKYNVKRNEISELLGKNLF